MGMIASGLALRDRVEEYIHSGSSREMFARLLDECVGAHSHEALSCVQRLFEDSYGGFTYNYELKLPAGAALITWGKPGAEILLEATIAAPSSKNVSICTQVLACVASRTEVPLLKSFHPGLVAAIEQSINDDPELPSFCKSRLVELVLSFENDEVGHRIGHSLTQLSFGDEVASRPVFSALAARWLAISRPLIREFESLIAENADDESVFQAFLSRYPQFLDPLVVDLWSQPDLHGAKRPDFVLRRSDNSYLIIEIEKPGKPIITKGGQLTADVTQAEKQVVEYASFLMRRYESTQRFFPYFDSPDCLVIVGIQSDLSDEQSNVLRDANSCRNRLKIVGFDWLAERAKVVVENIIQHGIMTRRIRMT